MARKDTVIPGSIDLDEALDRSLALLQRGGTPEDCLARFPEHAEELRPLLEVAVQIRRVPTPVPSAAGAAEGKRRMREALARKEEAQSSLDVRARAWISGVFEGITAGGIDVQRVLRSAAVAAAVVALIAIGTVAFGSWQRTMVGHEAILKARGGQVEVLPSGSDTWLPVSEYTLVEVGDRIRTDTSGSADLMFFEGSIAELGPEAELTIAQMASQRGGRGRAIVLHQWLGQTHNHVQPLVDEDSRFRIETASAVVSVRGTSFTLTVEPDGSTLLAVHEGAVEVQTRDRSVLLGEGEEILVESAQPSPTPASETTPEPTDTPVPSGSEPSIGPPSTGPPWSLWMVETPEQVTATPTPTPTATPTATATPTPTATTTPTLTATMTPAPPATEAPAPAPTREPSSGPTPTEEPRPPKVTPPGQTKTPQPPGLTKTPPGQDKRTPEPGGDD